MYMTCMSCMIIQCSRSVLAHTVKMGNFKHLCKCCGRQHFILRCQRGSQSHFFISEFAHHLFLSNFFDDVVDDDDDDDAGCVLMTSKMVLKTQKKFRLFSLIKTFFVRTFDIIANPVIVAKKDRRIPSFGVFHRRSKIAF